MVSCVQLSATQVILGAEGGAQSAGVKSESDKAVGLSAPKVHG